VLRYSLGLRLLADDVQLVSVNDVSWVRQTFATSHSRHTSSERHRLPPAKDAQLHSFGASVSVPLKGLLSHVRHGTHTPFMYVRRVKITLA